MKRTTMLRAALGAALVGLALVSAGCVRVELPRPDYTTANENIQLAGAEEVRAVFEMGAGVLNLRGGGGQLMDASFGYSDETWEPTVAYEVNGTVGDLTVKTPNIPHMNFGTHMRYQWDVTLGDDIPLDLAVSMGAGESTLDLSGLDLRRLQVDVGAGESTIDLSGDWRNDLDASITAGVGQLNLKVPTNVGVRIVGLKDGLGDYQADGFKQDGNALVNDAYAGAGVKLEIDVQRGIGEVVVELVP